MSFILVVEDEKHLADGLLFNLEAEGYQVEVAGDGETALERLLRRPDRYKAVILDVMLPGKDGFTIALELRRAGQFVPLLMLTARGSGEDVLRGFESGADDYLPKPFDLAILLARLKGLLRRRGWLQRDRIETNWVPQDNVFQFQGRTIDFGTLEIRVADRIVPLTLMEAQLLNHLVKHAGQALSRKSILAAVWGLHEDTDTRAIDNFMVRLRRYIEDEPTKPQFLLTVRGVGYRFVAEPETARKDP